MVGKATVFDKVLDDSNAEICPDEPSTEIKLDESRGVIQWYEALKNDTSLYIEINANAILSANTQTLTTPDDLLFEHIKYYKAKVKNGVCPAVISNIVPVRTCKLYDFVPNALTPGTNNQNSFWDIAKLKLSSRSTVTVFNRYGIEVFSQKGDYFKTNNWEGDGLPAGTYYYIIERNDGINKEPIKGDLTIMR
ncbi:MAG: gliding motility-associated C-terminal domain-containing protein [Bacteroidetes bacterium]|nr:MAG: gliding motility-associated C-terminal domain-containing protein [Bacteroidota bacterium]